jgi:hypothetical protein
MCLAGNGLWTGALRFSSNMILGAGSRDTVADVCMGNDGFLSGFFGTAKKYMILELFTFLWGFILGWVMNLWYVTAAISEISALKDYSCGNSIIFYGFDARW